MSFCVELTNIVDFEFSIYDRWGGEILYSANQAKCWDGEISGTEAAEGVYYYIPQHPRRDGRKVLLSRRLHPASISLRFCRKVLVKEWNRLDTLEVIEDAVMLIWRMDVIAVQSKS